MNVIQFQSLRMSSTIFQSRNLTPDTHYVNSFHFRRHLIVRDKDAELDTLPEFILRCTLRIHEGTMRD
jgi:hypothetical protein